MIWLMRLEMGILNPVFVDTIVLVHTLFDVDPSKQKRCVALIERAGRGEVKLWTNEWVVAELVWFLTKQGFGWVEVRGVIQKLLATTGLVVQGKQMLLEVMEECDSNRDFVDVIHLVLMRKKGVSKMYSYDKGFDKWSDVGRVEP